MRSEMHVLLSLELFGEHKPAEGLTKLRCDGAPDLTCEWCVDSSVMSQPAADRDHSFIFIPKCTLVLLSSLYKHLF